LCHGKALNAVDIAAWQLAVHNARRRGTFDTMQAFRAAVIDSRASFHGPQCFSLRDVSKHALDVAVQRPHDADTHVHQEVAVFCGDDNANRPTGRPGT